MARYVINDILSYEKDHAQMAGDCSHIGEAEVYGALAVALHEILTDGWQGLPFECEAESEDDALEKYIAQYYQYGYIKPTEADIELITE